MSVRPLRPTLPPTLIQALADSWTQVLLARLERRASQAFEADLGWLGDALVFVDLNDPPAVDACPFLPAPPSDFGPRPPGDGTEPRKKDSLQLTCSHANMLIASYFTQEAAQ
jgi:hypothetical protein